MMKVLRPLTIAVLAALALVWTGCQKSAESPAQTQQYTCPMHPEVVQDGAGKCPKCNMDLVPKT